MAITVDAIKVPIQADLRPALESLRKLQASVDAVSRSFRNMRAPSGGLSGAGAVGSAATGAIAGAVAGAVGGRQTRQSFADGGGGGQDKAGFNLVADAVRDTTVAVTRVEAGLDIVDSSIAATTIEQIIAIKGVNESVKELVAVTKAAMSKPVAAAKAAAVSSAIPSERRFASPYATGFHTSDFESRVMPTDAPVEVEVVKGYKSPATPTVPERLNITGGNPSREIPPRPVGPLNLGKAVSDSALLNKNLTKLETSIPKMKSLTDRIYGASSAMRRFNQGAQKRLNGLAETIRGWQPGINRAAEGISKIGSAFSAVGGQIKMAGMMLSAFITAPIVALAGLSLKHLFTLPAISPLIKELKDVALTLIHNIAIILNDVLHIEDVLALIVKWAKILNNYIISLPKGFLQFGVILAGVLAAIGPIVLIIGGIVTAAGALIAAIGAIAGAIGFLAGTVIPFVVAFAIPIAAIVAATLAWVAALAAAVYMWYEFTSNGRSFMQWLKDGFSEVGQLIKNWSLYTVGFVLHFQENLKILIEWFGLEWRKMLVQSTLYAMKFLIPIFGMFNNTFDAMMAELFEALGAKGLLDPITTPKFNTEIPGGKMSPKKDDKSSIFARFDPNASSVGAATKGSVDAYSLFDKAFKTQIHLQQSIAEGVAEVAENTGGLNNMNVVAL